MTQELDSKPISLPVSLNKAKKVPKTARKDNAKGAKAKKKRRKASENEENQWITRCVCGFSHDDGFMICCDKCSVWQHIECTDVNPRNVPESFFCEICVPRPVNVDRAIAIQKKKIQNQELEDDTEDSLDEETSPASHVDLLPPLIRSAGSAAESSTLSSPTPRGPIKEEPPLVVATLSIMYDFIEDDIYREEVFDLISAQNAAASSILLDADAHLNLANREDPFGFYSKYLSVRKTSSGKFGLFAEEVIYPRQFITFYKGVFIKKSSLVLDHDESRPFFFAHNHLDLCVDARKYGNDTRFIRRSCQPNCEARDVYLNGKLHIGIFAAANIIALDQELTIPFGAHLAGFFSSIECACENSDCVSLSRANSSSTLSSVHKSCTTLADMMLSSTSSSTSLLSFSSSTTATATTTTAPNTSTAAPVNPMQPAGPYKTSKIREKMENVSEDAAVSGRKKKHAISGPGLPPQPHQGGDTPEEDSKRQSLLSSREERKMKAILQAIQKMENKKDRKSHKTESKDSLSSLVVSKPSSPLRPHPLPSADPSLTATTTTNTTTTTDADSLTAISAWKGHVSSGCDLNPYSFGKKALLKCFLATHETDMNVDILSDSPCPSFPPTPSQTAVHVVPAVEVVCEPSVVVDSMENHDVDVVNCEDLPPVCGGAVDVVADVCMDPSCGENEGQHVGGDFVMDERGEKQQQDQAERVDPDASTETNSLMEVSYPIPPKDLSVSFDLPPVQPPSGRNHSGDHVVTVEDEADDVVVAKIESGIAGLETAGQDGTKQSPVNEPFRKKVSLSDYKKRKSNLESEALEFCHVPPAKESGPLGAFGRAQVLICNKDEDSTLVENPSLCQTSTVTCLPTLCPVDEPHDGEDVAVGGSGGGKTPSHVVEGEKGLMEEGKNHEAVVGSTAAGDESNAQVASFHGGERNFGSSYSGSYPSSSAQPYPPPPPPHLHPRGHSHPHPRPFPRNPSIHISSSSQHHHHSHPHPYHHSHESSLNYPSNHSQTTSSASNPSPSWASSRDANHGAYSSYSSHPPQYYYPLNPRNPKGFHPRHNPTKHGGSYQAPLRGESRYRKS